MFTQRSYDAIILTWKTRHFRHFTSQHFEVCKRKVFEKVIPAANFRISADDICQKNVKIGGFVLNL